LSAGSAVRRIVITSVMAVAIAVISSVVIRFGLLSGWLPMWARRRVSAASFFAWVSVIHWLTTAGSPPASRVAR
jgi:hypothetical protein